MADQLVPKEMFFTKGVGKHKLCLQSFEEALRDARVAQFNLVRVSSIYPPHCRVISRSAGLRKLSAGGITHCVIAEARTDEPNRLACAGIGLAIPAERGNYGYVAEHHGFGLTHKRCSDLVEDMAAAMLATTHGIELDPNTAYDERREIYKAKGLIVNTRAVVQTAEGDKNGLWTTVVAAAVFCC